MSRDALARLSLVACVACGAGHGRAPNEPPRASHEELTAEVFIVGSWREAYAKADGFDEKDKEPTTEKEAQEVLCRMEACKGPPPWIVKAHLFPFRSPATALAPLSDGRFAVVPLGLTGSGQCIDGKGDVTNTMSGHMEGDVIVLDEEVQPLAFVAEGRCEEHGPIQHIRRRVDPHRARQTVERSRNLDQ